MIKRIAFILLLISFVISTTGMPLFAQQAEEIEKIERELEKEKLLRERIEKEKEKEKPVIEEKPVVEEAPPPARIEKVLIKKINVRGATFLSEKEINNIILPFENKELTLRGMQKVANLITDAYRQKGYITSRVYLPPQNLEQGILEIRIIEGITGEIEIKGNRYFKSPLLKKKITLKEGEPFNYNILRKNLSKINEHPDRTSRAVLVPGKEPGTTDLVLEVKDRLPIHIGFNWDNFGSRYIERDRYRITLSHNNLLGWDDILTLQYQLAEARAYRLTSARYLFPLTEGLKLGVFVAHTRLDLGRELEEVDAWGKSRLYSIYAIQSLIDEENIALILNLGFDYKDIFNYQFGDQTSADKLRVAKVGLDVDLADRFGRTIIINELNFGIPDIMGGLRNKDELASRADSGGKFTKYNLSLLRLHRMPFNSMLLWKNQLQFTSYTLTAAEQFQIGGISNVRGYPPAEFVGDKGYATTFEWSFPPYPVPKNVKVPLSRAIVYDALRVALFYDWANARLKRPQPGEEKSKSLSTAGVGLRVTLPENFSARIDFGWPLDETPSDNKDFRSWAQVSKGF